MQKCFDSVVPRQATAIWRHLGAPLEVLHLLDFFYDQSLRRFETKDAVAAGEFRASRSILQGCCASPALLAGLMYMWGHTVLQVSPYVKLSVYIDDRTLWCRRRQGVEDLRRAIQVTMQLDSALGFSFHSNKCQFFGCGVVSQRALHNVSEDLQLRWPVVGTFKLLGVHYNLLVETKFFPFSDKLQLLVLRRLSRIKLIEVPRRTKIKAVRMMVISLFSWSGAWQSLTKKVLGQWRIAIEKAIMSPVRHRFRFLLWAASLGPYVDPEFCLNFEALRHQQWKCSSRAPRAIDRTSVSSRLNQVLASWD